MYREATGHDFSNYPSDKYRKLIVLFTAKRLNQQIARYPPFELLGPVVKELNNKSWTIPNLST